ncbi:MAG TPA: response regulator transcription factor [Usitatibacter sp.]|jgi:FixJ family two-component response regulator|nr:response regulator transcription factor [Usitatibacter sp.]
MTPDAHIVYVVDDDASVREALSSLLRSIGLEVVTFASADEFLACPLDERPSCLVLDVRLPGLSGLELQRELAARGRGIPIIFITGHGDVPMSVRAMKGGAVEFLQKPFLEEELVAAIRLSLERDREQGERRREMIQLRQRYESLTAREREVLAPIVRGMLNKQVAAALGISEITVKVHRRHVMQKLGARSLPEMVRMVERLGLGSSR